MEIKETNNILNMIMAGRGNAQSVPSSNIAEDFAALLARPNFSVDDKGTVSSGVEASIRTSEKEMKPAKDKNVEPRQNDRVEAERENKAPREDKKVAKNDDAAPKKHEDKVSDNSQKTENAQDKVSNEKQPARVDNKKVAENVSEGQAPAEMQQGEAADAGEQKISAYIISLDALAQLGNILVQNPQSGEWVQTTGAALAAGLMSSSDTMPVVLSMNGQLEGAINILPLNQEGQVMLPAELAEDGMNLQGFTPVHEGETFEMALAQANKNGQVVADMAAPEAAQDVAEQMLPAEELTVDNKKIRLKFDVVEEKTAAKSSDLLADTLAVEEVLQEAKIADTNVAVKTEPVKTANPEGVQNPMLNAAQNIAGAAQVQNGAAAAMQTVAEVSAKAVAAPAVEAGAGHTAQAVVSGSEFVASAKAEALAQDNKASFKDVYKGMSREVVEQVKVNITKSAVKGIDKIDVHLKPEDLGNIEIKMQLSKDGKLQAHIISSRPETMEILQKEIQTLEKAFNDAGFQTDEGSLSFSFREDGSAAGEREGNNALRNFIGDVLSQEAETETVADMYTLESWNGKSGLNIRV